LATTRHRIQHDLDWDCARHLIERAYTYYSERYPAYKLSLSWLDPRRAELRLHTRGKELLAQVVLFPGEVAVEMEVPLLFLPFAGRAHRSIDRAAQSWLSSQSPDRA
jgi:hypothetical protein